MIFLGWINLTVVLFLLAAIHESSAEISNWAKIVFRARQAEARRNRLKFKDEEFKEGATRLYASFLLIGGQSPCTDFVWPALVEERDGNLVQKFQRPHGDFHLVCRRGSDPAGYSSVQDSALKFLDTGNAFFYAPAEESFRTGQASDTFDLVPTPLTETERAYLEEKNKTMFNLCGYAPMPGILLHTTTTTSKVGSSSTEKNSTYKYGDGNNKCNYLEFGIEKIWLPLYNICYDKENFVTGFTKHTIYSKYITDRKLNFNLDFSAYENLYVKDDLNRFYRLKNQERSFQSDPKTFEKELQMFDMESNYLVRARLIPEFDMLSESWQYGVNNALNYAPMWRSVHMGQWLKVEQDIRHLAYKFNVEALTVYTGVYYKSKPSKLYYISKTHTEPSTSKKKSPFISLSKSTSSSTHKWIPIPSIFFKYVHSIEAGIVLITANGVSGSLNDIACRDVCSKYGWHFTDQHYQHRNIVEFGETKCCTPKDFFKNEKFQQFIPDPPSDSKSPIKNILTGGGQEIDPATGRPKPRAPSAQTAGHTMPFVPRPGVSLTTHYLIGGGLRP